MVRSIRYVCSLNFFLLPRQALRDEIAQNKALVDTLEDTGREIIADSGEDPQVVRDVRGELNKIVAPVDVILRKLGERQVKLQNALLRSQEFQVSLITFALSKQFAKKV